MEKKYRLLCMICSTCGIVGAILMIIAAFLEDGFPRPLWFVTAICMLLNVIGIIVNYRYVRKQEKADITEERK